MLPRDKAVVAVPNRINEYKTDLIKLWINPTRTLNLKENKLFVELSRNNLVYQFSNIVENKEILLDRSINSLYVSPNNPIKLFNLILFAELTDCTICSVIRVVWGRITA